LTWKGIGEKELWIDEKGMGVGSLSFPFLSLTFGKKKREAKIITLLLLLLLPCLLFPRKHKEQENNCLTFGKTSEGKRIVLFTLSIPLPIAPTEHKDAAKTKRSKKFLLFSEK
jgi:hypothetical protein